MLNALRGAGPHLVELGGGGVLGRQRVRWLYRVGVTPFYGFVTEARAYPARSFFPSIGLSAGHTF
jgi:hypothetical protein